MGKIDTELNAVFSLYIKCRDNWQCVRCGMLFQIPLNHTETARRADKTSFEWLDNSHYFGRGRWPNLKFEKDNCDALCRFCHNDFENKKSTDYKEFKENQLGSERYEALLKKKNGVLRLREPDKIDLMNWLLEEIEVMGYTDKKLEKIKEGIV